MDKLQQLTRKLYEEGLEKGREESGRLIEEARRQSERTIAGAKAEAERIVAAAERKAEEMARNSANEVALASRQSVAELKKAIASTVVAKTIEAPVAGLSLDAEFIREMLLTVAGKWDGSSGLAAQLPEGLRERFEAAVGGSLSELLAAGVEIRHANGVKSGFRIGPREGGYYIGFTDEDLRALVGGYLRAETFKILFGE